MDALKNFANKAQGNASGHNSSAPAAGQKDDYGDKGMYLSCHSDLHPSTFTIHHLPLLSSFSISAV